MFIRKHVKNNKYNFISNLNLTCYMVAIITTLVKIKIGIRRGSEIISMKFVVVKWSVPRVGLITVVKVA